MTEQSSKQEHLGELSRDFAVFLPAISNFYNTFISNKITMVNMIQDVAHRLGNMDVDKVTEALAKSTQRIVSPAYMKAGM